MGGLDLVKIEGAAVVGGEVVIPIPAGSNRAGHMTAAHAPAQIELAEFRPERAGRGGISHAAEHRVADPDLGAEFVRCVQLARPHGAGAEVQSGRQVPADAAHQGLVPVPIAHAADPAVLHREGIRDAALLAVQRHAFVHAPEVRHRMRDERVADRGAELVLLAERDGDATDPEVQEARVEQVAQDVFALEVVFAELEVFVQGLALGQNQFAVEERGGADFGFDEQPRLIDAEFAVGIFVAGLTGKEVQAAHAGDDDPAAGRLHRRAPLGRVAAQILRLRLAVRAFPGELFDAGHQCFELYLLALRLFAQETVLLHQLPEARLNGFGVQGRRAADDEEGSQPPRAHNGSAGGARGDGGHGTVHWKAGGGHGNGMSLNVITRHGRRST